MSPADVEWPALLRAYESAIAEFEGVSGALTGALMTRTSTDDDLRALIVAEEVARESVVLARMRLINLWRDSGAELERRAGLPSGPGGVQPQ